MWLFISTCASESSKSSHCAAGPQRGQLQGIQHDCNDIPDAAMTLAVAALFANGPTRIDNVYNWRVKETERMVAIVTECRKLGAEV
jgi:3-phosphoshikimate 1-carboxyvinyltransferase